MNVTGIEEITTSIHCLANVMRMSGREPKFVVMNKQVYLALSMRRVHGLSSGFPNLNEYGGMTVVVVPGYDKISVVPSPGQVVDD